VSTKCWAIHTNYWMWYSSLLLCPVIPTGYVGRTRRSQYLSSTSSWL